MINENVILIKNLVGKIGDLSEITLQQRNFFLYDESNYINHTFYTRVEQKSSNVRCNFYPCHRNKKTYLTTPATSLKSRVTEDKYKEQIFLQLEDIRKPGKMATKDSKITNFFNFKDRTEKNRWYKK